MKDITFRRLFIRTILCISFIVGFTYSCESQDYDRDSWQRPEKVMDVIGVKPGMVIGEAGAGRGYFTFKLAKRVGDTGKIYANDISRRALNYIQGRCRREGIDNIEIILGEVENPLFPKSQMDMVIMVYVFHHLKRPVEFLKNIKPSLKPGAPLVILEQDPEKSDEAIGHFLKKEVILDKVKESGYELVWIETFLPKDNIYIYRSIDVQSSE